MCRSAGIRLGGFSSKCTSTPSKCTSMHRVSESGKKAGGWTRGLLGGEGGNGCVIWEEAGGFVGVCAVLLK